MNGNVKITFENGVVETYPAGVTFLELSKNYQNNIKNQIIGAKVNNVYYQLDEKVVKDSKVKFVDITDSDGYTMYKSGLKFVLYVAIKELFGEAAEVIYYNSIDKGVYAKVEFDESLTDKLVSKIKNKMGEIISQDYPIIKQIVKNRDVIDHYHNVHEEEKAINAENSTNMTLSLYKLKNYFNYFYTAMPSSTGVLGKFDITIADKTHIILRYPTASSEGIIPEYNDYPKTLESFEKYREWLNTIKVPYVSDLNKIVSKNGIREFIMMNYTISEGYYSEIAKKIAEKDKKSKVKVVFMSGPSSSGKTTSSKKLALHLKAYGLKPFPISGDDFYCEREDTPKLPDGSYDFECIEALDLHLMDKTINKLIKGESTLMPSFNFFTGKKEFKNKPIKLGKDSVIIFEGIHCLNERITKFVPLENQYKVYISPFPGINIDRHNYISSVDLRLIRRMVRDNVFRGYPVEHTMEMWPNVRRGEEKYVFPFQGSADSILNSSLVYELGVLRVFAEPLLASVPITSEYYEEARRLLSFLRGFFSINPEYVSRDTVLREFIGDSIFF